MQKGREKSKDRTLVSFFLSTWVAQSVKCLLLLAQVLISRFVGLSPALGLSLSLSALLLHTRKLKNTGCWGAWVAQSVERPTSAQVTILRSVSSSPASGSGLMAQSLEPASDSVSPSLSAPSLFMLCLSLSVSKIKKNLKKIKKKKK